MADLTVDVNWEIEPPRESLEVGARRFDQHTASDQGFGPEPESPESPAPEVDGK